MYMHSYTHINYTSNIHHTSAYFIGWELIESSSAIERVDRSEWKYYTY